MKSLLIGELVIILLLLGQFLRLRRVRARLCNQLLKIVYEVQGRKGVVSSLTMHQSVHVIGEALGKK